MAADRSRIPQVDRYAEIRPSLRTGDVVLFQGRGFASWLIRKGSGPWTHTGLVWRFREPKDVVMIFESTTLSKVKDSITGTIKEGPALRLLSSVISDYNGCVAIRRIAGPPWSDAKLHALSDFRRAVYDREYETSYWQLLKSAWDGWFGDNERDTSSLFCSEINYEQHSILGCVDGRNASNEVTPTDYSEEAYSRDTVEMVGEYSWIDQQIIKGAMR